MNCLIKVSRFSTLRESFQNPTIDIVSKGRQALGLLASNVALFGMFSKMRDKTILNQFLGDPKNR